IWGELQPVRFRELSSHDVLEFLTEFMTPVQRETLESETAVDFAYDSPHGRFRVNVYRHSGGLGAAFRAVAGAPPQLETLGLPNVVQQLLAVGKGLVLWLPNGAVICDELEKLAREWEFRDGYQRVRTPHMTRGITYQRSGHLSLYKAAMYPPMVPTETGAT
ncbi:MAG TPA: hypothetical protein PL106_00600, partial [Flavobacteriales bacterium]|nr:hypothetical protein [Flavobacteriales bacterium]